FNITHGIITKVAHQTASEAWQCRQVLLGRHFKLSLKVTNIVKRICTVLLFNRAVRMLYRQFTGITGKYRRFAQPNNRIACPVFSTFDRFKQISLLMLLKTRENRKWGIRIGQTLTVHWNQVIALCSKLLELCLCGHAVFLFKLGLLSV